MDHQKKRGENGKGLDRRLYSLNLKTTNKSTFCEALVCNLEPMCSLEISDLDCLVEKVEVEEPIKRESSEVANAGISVTYLGLDWG